MSGAKDPAGAAAPAPAAPILPAVVPAPATEAPPTVPPPVARAPVVVAVAPAVPPATVPLAPRTPPVVPAGTGPAHQQRQDLTLASAEVAEDPASTSAGDSEWPTVFPRKRTLAAKFWRWSAEQAEALPY